MFITLGELLILHLIFSSVSIVICALIQMLIYFWLFKAYFPNNFTRVIMIFITQILAYSFGLVLWRFWPFTNVDIMIGFINLPTLAFEMVLLPVVLLIYKKHKRK